MAAPQFVPTAPVQRARRYTSAPWRTPVWVADRPGDFGGRQPEGDQLGTPGPDQGYALTLAEHFRGKLHLAPGESEDDAIAGAVAVALKRAALFGRAPVIHDVRIGLSLWGFLEQPTDEVLARRRDLFEGCHQVHHYEKLRSIADAIDPELLHRPVSQIL